MSQLLPTRMIRMDSDLSPIEAEMSRNVAKTRRIEIVLFLMLLAAYVYFLPRWADWSQDSRLDLTLAIVDQHTLSIDNYYQNTGDYALFNGRHYLDKAPGPSLLAVPIYIALKPILSLAPVQGLMDKMAHQPAFQSTLREGGSGLLETKIYRAVVLYVVTVLLVALPSAFLGVLLFRVLGFFEITSAWRAAIVLIYGLATNAFAYAGAFYSHQLTAFLLFASFYLCIAPSRLHAGWGRNLLIGLMIGLALISEYPTALIGGAVTVLAMLTSRARTHWAALLVGGMIPGAVLAAYDWAIFGTILPVGYEYSALYQDIHSVGLISLTYPHLDAMWGITFGSFRGLFFLSPVLLLSLWGYWAWAKSGLHRSWLIVSAFSTLGFFLFYSSSAMWQGGYAVGPRYLVPMVPFMVLSLGALVRTYGAKRGFQVLVLVLGLGSMGMVWTETISGQAFPDWTANPLVNYSLPRLLSGDIARNLGMSLMPRSFLSLVPLLGAELAGVFALLAIIRHKAVLRLSAWVPTPEPAGEPN